MDQVGSKKHKQLEKGGSNWKKRMAHPGGEIVSFAKHSEVFVSTPSILLKHSIMNIRLKVFRIKDETN